MLSAGGGSRAFVVGGKRRRGKNGAGVPPSPKKHRAGGDRPRKWVCVFSGGAVHLLTLEVVLESGEESQDLEYQWMIDGEPLAEEPPYSQVRQTQLKINSSGLEPSPHSFSCSITDSGFTEVSEPFTLSLESVLDHLKPGIVSKHAECPNSKPVASLFTNCIPFVEGSYALIENQSWSNKSAFYLHSIRGSSDITKEKKSINYCDIFKGLDPGTKVAILGRPGIGKSTLAYKLIFDWAQSNISFANTKCVFLLDLHYFPKDATLNFASFLSFYFEGDAVEEYESFICKLEGRGVCLIVNGLEKYHVAKHKDTFVYKLLLGDVLPKSSVIATCRPLAASRWNLWSENVRQIEILGLSKSNINDFIQAYPFDSNAKASQLCRFMSKNPNILFLAYVPAVLNIFCYVFNILGAKMPTTATKIYESFVVSCIKNVTKSKRGQQPELSIHTLAPKQRVLFGKLCQLAYRKLLPREESLALTELKKIIGSNDHLMRLFYPYEDHAYFLHISVQQFMAAVHISKLQNEAQLKIVNKSCNRNSAKELLWIFFFGLNPVSLAQKLDSVVQSTKKKTSFHCRCIFEAQKPSLCKQFVKKNNVLPFGHVMTPWDLFALAYILSNAPIGSAAVELYYTEIDMEGVRAFEKGVKKFEKDLKLKGFKFQYYSCSLNMIELVVRFLKVLKSCLSTDFSKCLLTMPKLKSILSAGVAKTARSLNFTSCLLYAISFKLLARHLRSCQNLDSLILHDNWMHLKGAKALASGFKNCSNLKELAVHGEPEALAELSIGFRHLKKIQSLSIHGNKLPEVAMKNLSHCKQLRQIDFARCIFESEGASALGNTLQSLTLLKVLDLTSCCIDPQHMKPIAEGMKHLPQLTSLLLELVRVGGEGVQYVSENFQFCPNLEILNFQHCGIEGNDAKIFLYNFRHCAVLKQLNLSWNYLNDDCLQILFDSLQTCCNSLEELLLDGNRFTSSQARTFAERISGHHCKLLKFTIDRY